MTNRELAELLRQIKVETGSLMCLGCGYEHNCGVHGCNILHMAVDALGNSSRHVEALQQEIERLRKAAWWIHDGLYICDPEKNKLCKKRGCKSQCFHTAFPEFAAARATHCPNCGAMMDGGADDDTGGNV